MELEGRITPTQWLDTVNGINEILISAHSLKHAAFHHVLAVFTLYVSTLMIRSHYDKVSRDFNALYSHLTNLSRR